MNALSQPRSSQTPVTPSAFAAQQLSPSFPARAAWGTGAKLRAWQQEALDAYMQTLVSQQGRDFLLAATPGAGKTTFALRVATELLSRREIAKVTVVCPTEHLKSQWADAAAHVGIQLDPAFTNAQLVAGAHFDGVCVTYAQVGANPSVHKARTQSERTLVILDEIHHAGDSLTWGDGVAEAFESAARRLSMTGTPFRSDTSPIPFVTYVEDGEGIKRSRADYTYGYGDALRDFVVRPVLFMTYSGTMRWRTKAGDEYEARLGEPLTKDLTKQAWRTALDPEGEWIRAVIAAADQRLTEVRRSVPDAGGLVIASNKTAARSYARVLRELTGKAATVVLSDDEGASEKIDLFAGSTDRWMVAVRMVSEGVDIPRMAVGVYATSASTPLFFAQAIGRFVRARRRGETASVFLPSVAPLLQLASELERERDHALGKPYDPDAPTEEDLAMAQVNAVENASDDLLGSFEALDAHAEFDRVLFDGSEFGLGAEVGSVEEQDFLGIPGLLEPEQVTTLLRAHQAKQAKAQKNGGKGSSAHGPNAVSQHRLRAERRKELNQLVAAWARRSGEPHGVVHTKLRKTCGGPEVPQATIEEIEARIAKLRNWFVGRT